MFKRLMYVLLTASLLLGACSSPATPAPTAAPTAQLAAAAATSTTAPVAAAPASTDTTVPPTAAPTDTAVLTAAATDTTVPPTTAPTDTTVPPTAAPTNTAVPPTEAPTDTAVPPTLPPHTTLILATTTSTADTGLLSAILPYFEARDNVTIKVIAVGTGQALAIGAKGDADVLLVHARAQEDAFVAAGNGIDRRDVMYNDFVVVGPAADPAGIAAAATAKEAFAKMAAAGAPFASRGDGSGTHTKEKSLWTAAGITPKSGQNGYAALGQGMGETLSYANETGSYTLTDRGTWLARQAGLTGLMVLFGGTSIKTNPDTALYNPYGVIAVNPAKFPKVNYVEASRFIEWITSLSIQRRIYSFGRDLYGQSLFYPTAQVP